MVRNVIRTSRYWLPILVVLFGGVIVLTILRPHDAPPVVAQGPGGSHSGGGSGGSGGSGSTTPGGQVVLLGTALPAIGSSPPIGCLNGAGGNTDPKVVYDCPDPPSPPAPPKPATPPGGPGNGGPGCRACGGVTLLAGASASDPNPLDTSPSLGARPGNFADTVSSGKSWVDNQSLNYIHKAYDYQSGDLNGLNIVRWFRGRDMTQVSSFGPGQYMNWDINLRLTYINPNAFGNYTGTIQNQQALLFDPSRLYCTGFAQDSTSSNLVYIESGSTLAKKSAVTRELKFFDAAGQPLASTSHYKFAKTAVLTLLTGQTFTFEIVKAGPDVASPYAGQQNDPFAAGQSQEGWHQPLDGRLLSAKDQNGYGVTLTYKTWTAAEIAASPERQWQIDTISDAYGMSAAVQYGTQQVGGRWAVSQFTVAGQSVSYTYASSKLSSVQHPDGSSSSFTFVPNQTNGCTKIEIRDVTASADHQHKNVYVQNSASATNGGSSGGSNFYWSSSSNLVRLIANPQDEVYYFNQDLGSDIKRYYEGGGRAKYVYRDQEAAHYTDGWTFASVFQTSNYSAGTETVRPSVVPGTNGSTGAFPTTTAINGVVINRTYDADMLPTIVTYSDSSTETYAYDSLKNVTRSKDRLGNVTKYTYDSNGNVLTQQVGLVDNGSGGETATAEAATTTYEYYPSGHAHQFLMKSSTDPLGNKTDYEYNTNHRLSKVISPPDTTGGVRAETEYLYDTAGRVSTALTPGGWGVTYTYDVRNRVTKLTRADGSTERTIYGTGAEANLIVKVKDRSGTVTKFEYDSSGRRIKTIQSYAAMDLADNETLITDPALKVEEVCTYIPGTELKASCVRAGEKTTYTYDYRHRVVETKTQPRVGKILASKSVYKDNKLFSTEDSYGRKTFYAYRASDAALVRTIQATVPSVSYADFAAVLAATRAAPTTPNPTSLITDYTLDNAGRTVATIDPLGITHTVAYDSRGRATEQIAASGTSVAAKTKTIYDLASRPVEVQYPRYFDSTDTNGFNKSRTTMTYTGRGLLASRTESPGTAEVATESYTYNIEGRQLTRVDARGFTWTTAWNTCCGRQQGSFDPYGHGTIVNVDNLGRATHTASVSNVTAHASNYKDPIDAQTLGEVTTKYDTRGRVSARTVWLTPLGQVDPNNVPIYTGTPVNNSASPPAAPYGLTTTYSYDDNLTDSTGLDSTFSTHLTGLSLGTDSDGSAVLTTNPAGERTLAIRDGLGRGVRSVQLDTSNAALTSNTTTFDTVVTITGYGDVLETASANALGHTNKSRTDGAGRTIQSLDATSAITTFTYDAGGRRLSVRDPNNVGQDCTYDALGRDLSCTDTAGAVTSRTYDLAGGVKTQVDAKSHTTSMIYDSRGRRTSMTDRINATTTWTFDAAGNELSMTDAENQTTAYGYDNSGRRVAIQWPDHVAGQTPGGANYGIEVTAYDEAGRKLRSTNQLGDTITQVYDMGSRLLKREYRTLANSPSGTIASQDTFTYDAGSRMLTGVKGMYSNTVAMAYDAGGRKSAESLTIAGQTYTTGTAYDTAGRISQLTYPDGSVVARTYDSRNLLSTISHDGTNIDSRSYDAGGRLSSETLGNGLVVTRTYMTGDNLPLAISNSVVGTYTYAWDANKNKTGETITGAMSPYSSTMGFDNQSRLTSWNRTNGNSQAWTLSPVNDWQSFTNNGTAVARTHGPTHEVLTVGSAAITHDSRGNMTSDEFTIARTYDVDNKVSQSIVPAGSTRGIVGTHGYQYDVLGRRVRKTIGGSSASDTVFALTGEQIVSDYPAGTAASSPTTKYLWGSYIDELVCQAASSTKLYPHRNQQYSTTALTDQTGAVVERYAYTSYGDLTVLNAAGATVLTTPPQTRYTYTGREYDHEAGTYHFRARIYSATQGRFTGHDPILYPDGRNTYAGWFSVRGTDPNGYRVITCSCRVPQRSNFPGTATVNVDTVCLESGDSCCQRACREDGYQPPDHGDWDFKTDPFSRAAGCCNGSASCVQELLSLINEINNTRIYFCSFDPCQRWVEKFRQKRLVNGQSLPFTRNGVTVNDVTVGVNPPGGFWGTITNHNFLSIKIGSCLFYADVGTCGKGAGSLGGDDHWFDPIELPDNYHPGNPRVYPPGQIGW